MVEDAPSSRQELREAAEAAEGAAQLLRVAVRRAGVLREALRTAARERAGLLEALQQLSSLYADQEEGSEGSQVVAVLCQALDEADQMAASEEHQLAQLLIEPWSPLCQDPQSAKRDLKALTRLRSACESLQDKVAAADRKDALSAKEQPRHDDSTAQLADSQASYRRSLLDYVDSLNIGQERMRELVLQQLLGWWTARLGVARAQVASLSQPDGRVAGRGGFTRQIQALQAKERAEIEAADVMVGAIVCHGHHVQGTLWQRSPGKLGAWNRKFFRVHDGYLQSLGEGGAVVSSLPLVTAGVKRCVDADRRNCFLVMGPSDELLLQAPSAREMAVWIKVLEEEQVRLLNQASLSSAAMHSRGEQRQAGEGPLAQLREADVHNAVCADCGAGGPEWAAINLGVLFCLHCSGPHRSLGVQYSKVRSFRLDSWSAGELAVMSALGNARVSRALFESRLPSSQRIGPDASALERERFVARKYQAREWLAVLPSRFEASQLGVALLETVEQKPKAPLDLVLLLLLHKAPVGWARDAADGGEFPLLAAARNGDLACLELLMLHGASPKQAAAPAGWTPLHVAASVGNIDVVLLLLRRGASPSATTSSGQTPAEMAASAGSADCVTLLRLAALSLAEREQQSGGADGVNSSSNSLNGVGGMDDALSFANILDDFSRNLQQQRNGGK